MSNFSAAMFRRRIADKNETIPVKDDLVLPQVEMNSTRENDIMNITTDEMADVSENATTIFTATPTITHFPSASPSATLTYQDLSNNQTYNSSLSTANETFIESSTSTPTTSPHKTSPLCPSNLSTFSS